MKINKNKILENIFSKEYDKPFKNIILSSQNNKIIDFYNFLKDKISNDDTIHIEKFIEFFDNDNLLVKSISTIDKYIFKSKVDIDSLIKYLSRLTSIEITQLKEKKFKHFSNGQRYKIIIFLIYLLGNKKIIIISAKVLKFFDNESVIKILRILKKKHFLIIENNNILINYLNRFDLFLTFKDNEFHCIDFDFLTKKQIYLLEKEKNFLIKNQAELNNLNADIENDYLKISFKLNNLDIKFNKIRINIKCYNLQNILFDHVSKNFLLKNKSHIIFKLPLNDINFFFGYLRFKINLISNNDERIFMIIDPYLLFYRSKKKNKILQKKYLNNVIN